MTASEIQKLVTDDIRTDYLGLNDRFSANNENKSDETAGTCNHYQM
jgi:hypothetical protein